jgi:hypothetical protein
VPALVDPLDPVVVHHQEGGTHPEDGRRGAAAHRDGRLDFRPDG